MRVGNVIEVAIATRRTAVGGRFSLARGCYVYLSELHKMIFAIFGEM
ncbi:MULTISPECIES: hypothetical protein [Okeania]|nr:MULTISPECIES: hypothetical protein [Okeania]NEP07696.1 hypothetical protein [Okeania sp. SIO4D6]NEP41383.1 hypothetical protein [Okeania sp. SIO2H7]NES91656.1 hypothetical protein [Okeania sp. SIO2B9]NET16056.1 hypothetical protein [Okeania sp. SIO1H6]NEP75439.1 hypothetical protein [Okeania sp. SIO2G5]